MNISENNVLAQALKNQLLDSKERLRKAKGASNINTFTVIYLREYVKIRFSSENEIVLCIMPSREKISKESLLSEKFNSVIKLEKEIVVFNIDSPMSKIAKEILLVIERKISIK